MKMNQCPICKSKEKEKLIDIQMEKFLGNHFKPIKIVKSICNDCGHIYANRYYDTTKHYKVTRASDSVLIYYDEDLIQTFDNLVQWMKTKVKSPTSILDVGCGKCDLMRVLNAHYSNTTIDPPELIYFIREYHKDVKWEQPND